MTKLLPELIDKILLILNDIHLSIELKRNFAIKKLCKINGYNINKVSIEGHLDIFKFLHNNGCEITDDIIEMVTKNGHFEILKWLYSKEFKFTFRIMEIACLYNHLEIVKWLHYKGIRSVNALYWADLFDSEEIVEFLESI